MIDLSAVPTDDLVAELKSRRDDLTRLTLSPDPAEAIKQLICDEFGITDEQLHMDTRQESISFPRQVAMTLMRENGLTWEDCAGQFYLHHASAIHAAKNITSKERSCATFAARLQHLRSALAGLGFQPLGTTQTSV